MCNRNDSIALNNMLRRAPEAVAYIKGDGAHPGLWGSVMFYEITEGVIVVAELYGLPDSEGKCDSGVFAFHIHEGGSCSGDEFDSLRNVGAHYNPDGCQHPYHEGDMPPLFSARGRAYLAFLTDRFTVDEIVGRTVIVHSRPDDFTTQPSGNSGTKIACGEILGIR